MFKSFFKIITAVVLLLSLTLSISSCGFDIGFGGTKPSEEAFKKAYSEKVEEFTEDIDDYYDLAEDYISKDVNLTANLSLNLSNELLNLVRSYTKEDFSWANDAEFTVSENIKGDITSMALGLSYKGKSIISSDVIVDLASGYAYLGSEELGGKYLKEKLEEFDTASFLSTVDVFAALPDKDALKSVIETCFKTAIKEIDGVEFSEYELKVNGVAEDCVEYVAELSQKDIANVCLSVLIELKNNNDFKKLVYDIVEYVNSAAGPENALGTPSKVYAELIEEIEDLIDDFSDSNEFSDEIEIIWTSYITNKLEIIGVKLDTVYGANSLFAAKTTDGDDVGYAMYVSEGASKLFEIEGSFVDDGKKLSGTYEISIDGDSMAFIDLKDVNVKELENKHFEGSVSISPSKDLIDMITASAGVSSVAGLNIASLSLKCDVKENNGKNLKATLSLMNGSSVYASITCDAKIDDGKTVSIPSNTTSDADAWLAGLDFSKLIDNAEKSGLPDYVIELLEVFSMQLK